MITFKTWLDFKKAEGLELKIIRVEESNFTFRYRRQTVYKIIARLFEYERKRGLP
jgi:hypothetical protein